MEASGETGSEVSLQPQDGGLLCSRCNRVLDENISISMDCPPMVCHEDCFTCAVCACALGDMRTPMFLHGQKVHCGSCYLNIMYP